MKMEIKQKVRGQEMTRIEAFICSECGAIYVSRITGGKIVNGDLCPNCGAKTIESQEKSDKE